MKKINVTIATGLMVILTGMQCLAQQEAMYTHYMFNTQGVNPAFAGSRPAFSVTTLHRSQWSVIPGHPVTQTLAMQTPLRRENMGLGLSLYNDRLGPERTTSVFGDYAYTIRVNEVSTLSMGIKAGISMHSINYNELYTEQPDDPLMRNRENSHWLPNVGFGLYYRHESFFAGFSIPHMMQQNFLSNSVIGGARFALKQRHYYFIAGTAIDISEDVIVVPTTYVKMTRGAPAELDLTTNFLFYERFMLGVMFRTRDALGVLAGLRITSQWMLCYSYDWTVINNIPNNNFGSHEVVLRYDFIFNDNHRITSPTHF